MFSLKQLANLVNNTICDAGVVRVKARSVVNGHNSFLYLQEHTLLFQDATELPLGKRRCR